MKRRMFGAMFGLGAGYLAAMLIAAVVPFNTGLDVRNVSVALALACCTVGACVGLLIALLEDRRRVGR